MVVATSPIALAVSVAAIVTSSTFLATVASHRHDPTARPLFAVALVSVVGATAHLLFVDLALGRAMLGIDASPAALSGGLWLLLAFDITALVSVTWFLFALQYTGRDDRTVLVAWAAAATVLVLLVGPHFELTIFESVVGFRTQASNVALGVAVVLAAALALIGLFLVLDVTLQHKAFPISQTAIHTVAVGSVLLVPFVATTARQPLTTPLSIATSSALFTGLVSRYRLFETLPIVSVVGRDRVVEAMSDGVVIVGSDRRVRDLNPTAERLFGVDRETTVGRSLATVIPAVSDLSSAARTTTTDVTLESGRTVSISVEETTDHRGRPLGWLFVCQDVTERRQQTHRLGVLTRAVAGVTTEQMRSVTDVTAGIEAGDCDPSQGGDRIRETTTTVAELVDNVREIETALSAQPEAANPASDLGEVVASLSVSEGIELTVEPTAEQRSVAADGELVAGILEALLAVTDSATLRTDSTADTVTVEIRPFDGSDPDSIEGLTLRIAEIAAESASWELEAVQDSTPPAVRLSFPALSDETQSGGESA